MGYPPVKSSGYGKQNAYSGLVSAAYTRKLQQEDVDRARAESQRDPFERYGIPTEEAEDYNLENLHESVHGIPITSREPKLKPEVPNNILLDFKGSRSKSASLSNQLTKLIHSKNIQNNLNPFNPMAHRGLIGDLSAKVASLANSKDIAEFTEFKANTDRDFQEYRKYITGVNAGFPEIQFLQPIYPQTTDPPSKYVSTALGALEDMKRNDELIMQTASQAGYRTRGFKGGFSS